MKATSSPSTWLYREQEEKRVRLILFFNTESYAIGKGTESKMREGEREM